MSAPPALHRSDVLAMLAAQQSRPVEAVSERIDSLDLAWLVHSVQERYGVLLDLGDAEIAGMTTVSDAVRVLRKTLADAGAR